MSKHFVVFGNHPALALAELVSVLNDAKLLAVKGKTAVVESAQWDGARLMKTLGGTVKLGDIALESKMDKLKPQDIAELLAAQHPTHAPAQKSKTTKTKPAAAAAPASRTLDFGLSFFGDDKKRPAIEKMPMQIKKELKESGLSVRWVTADEGKELSPAAVVKCKLLQAPNADIVVIEEGQKIAKDDRPEGASAANKDATGKVYIGRTTHAQNADAWSERDFGRPRRDDRGGMLPPKLARMMVNLANVKNNGFLLDPFCGSGTVLMEAALATGAARIVGSDIAERCIRDTQANDDWLSEHGLLDAEELKRFDVFRCDARLIDKKIPANTVDAVVTEGWLGPPLQGDETEEHLRGIAQEVADIWRKTLIAIRPIMRNNSRLVIVVPSYKADKNVITPPVTEDLARLGFELAHPLAKFDKRPPALFYQRVDQHIRRNIYVLKPIVRD